MPLYEYRCKKCGLVFEILQKPHQNPIKKCIHCKGEVEKLISPPAIQFKGTGWYITDYAQNQKPSSPEKEDTKPEKQESTKEAGPKQQQKKSPPQEKKTTPSSSE